MLATLCGERRKQGASQAHCLLEFECSIKLVDNALSQQAQANDIICDAGERQAMTVLQIKNKKHARDLKKGQRSNYIEVIKIS